MLKWNLGFYRICKGKGGIRVPCSSSLGKQGLARILIKQIRAHTGHKVSEKVNLLAKGGTA